jgi:putative endonuclease
MYYIYVLESLIDKSWYIGRTNNIKRRIKEHNTGKSIYTNKKRPWKIIYIEGYLIFDDAKGREKYLKSGAGRLRLKEQMKYYLKSRL